MELLSTWNVIKSAGFTSYIFLFIAVALGAFSYGKQLPIKLRQYMLPAHQTAGRLGLLFGMLHGAVLLIDQYKPFAWYEIVVPFMAREHAVVNGMGTITLYALLLNLITSDGLKWFGKKLWRFIHVLAFPAFILALAHGLMIGSNTVDAWAQNIYVTTAIAFVATVIIRLVYGLKLKLLKGM